MAMLLSEDDKMEEVVDDIFMLFTEVVELFFTVELVLTVLVDDEFDDLVLDTDLLA